MRVRLLVATSVIAGLGALFACQTVTGLTDLEKVDCVECDAGTVVVIPPETGPTCAHTFCASFDDGPLITGWRAQATSPNATLMLDTQMPKSPPASFLAGVPKGETGSMVATLGQSFTVPLKGAHLELDMRVGQVGTFPQPDAGPTDAGGEGGAEGGVADAGGDGGDGGKDGGLDSGTLPAVVVIPNNVRVASIFSADVATASGVSIAWRNGGAFVLVVTPASGGNVSELALPIAPSPALDQWVHVKLDIVFSATGAGSVKMSIDGASVLDKSGLSIVGSGMGGAQLELGLVTRDTTPEFKASFDNVTLDLDP
jgi:hypothetical protein